MPNFLFALKTNTNIVLENIMIKDIMKKNNIVREVFAQSTYWMEREK